MKKVVVLVGAAMLSVFAVVQMVSADPSPSTIVACVSSTNNSVQYFHVGPKNCTGDKTKYEWSIAGVAGEDGEDGEDGVSGREQKSAAGTAGTDTGGVARSATVTCSDGKLAIGGGFSSNANPIVSTNRPTDDGTGWTVTGTRFPSSASLNWSMTAWVVCADITEDNPT